ncbi:MAG: hypothetical protein NTZ52_06050 [Chlamydiae bacterium]|nr:hypothetical protein [Chlamydiota bacterium]
MISTETHASIMTPLSLTGIPPSSPIVSCLPCQSREHEAESLVGRVCSLTGLTNNQGGKDCAINCFLQIIASQPALAALIENLITVVGENEERLPLLEDLITLNHTVKTLIQLRQAPTDGLTVSSAELRPILNRLFPRCVDKDPTGQIDMIELFGSVFQLHEELSQNSACLLPLTETRSYTATGKTALYREEAIALPKPAQTPYQDEVFLHVSSHLADRWIDEITTAVEEHAFTEEIAIPYTTEQQTNFLTALLKQEKPSYYFNPASCTNAEGVLIEHEYVETSQLAFTMVPEELFFAVTRNHDGQRATIQKCIEIEGSFFDCPVEIPIPLAPNIQFSSAFMPQPSSYQIDWLAIQSGGGAEGGHWTCVCKVENQWVEFNDAQVKILNDEEVYLKLQVASIIHYKKGDEGIDTPSSEHEEIEALPPNTLAADHPGISASWLTLGAGAAAVVGLAILAAKSRK